MLERIREGSQGTLSKVILGAVILSFAAAGVGGYLSSAATPPAAKVNGEEISLIALERAYQNERARIEDQMGDVYADLAANPDYLRSVRYGVLDQLVAQLLLDQTARDLGLRMGDDQLRDVIRSMEAFHIDGKFNNERYLAALRQAGLRTSDFRDQMRTDMSRQQLINALIGSEFSLEAEVERIVALQRQTRDIEQITVPAAAFDSQVTISDQQVTEYFEASQDRFMAPEQVSISYVELTVDELMADITVSEADAKAWYESHRNEYLRPERRRASHILFALDDKERAESVLAEIKAGGDFAELAKEHSTDTFSGRNGGDLDWFDRGVMVPEFEQAAFAMDEEGGVSELVESQFGYHIIRLTGIESEAVRDYAEVEQEIIVSLQRQQAESQFAELSEQLADLSFEIPDTLDDAAGAIGKSVITTEAMSRNSLPAPFNGSEAQRAVFSEQVLEDGMNSDLIMVSPDHALVLRLEEYQPPRPQTQDEVADDIRALLSQQAAAEMAQAEGERLVDAWQNGDSIEAMLAENDLRVNALTAVTRDSRDLAPQVLRELFSMPRPQDGQASVRLVDLGTDGVSVVRLLAVSDNDEPLTPEQQQQLSDALQNEQSQASYQALLEAMRAEAKIRYTGIE